MDKKYSFPVFERDVKRHFGFDPIYTNPTKETIDVYLSEGNIIVDHMNTVRDHCLCETGRSPKYFLLGGLAYLGFCLWATDRRDFDLNGLIRPLEYCGIDIIIDPSRKYYVQAIADEETIGSSCGEKRYVWEVESIK